MGTSLAFSSWSGEDGFDFPQKLARKTLSSVMKLLAIVLQLSPLREGMTAFDILSYAPGQVIWPLFALVLASKRWG